jgi:hypothetical protein
VAKQVQEIKLEASDATNPSSTTTTAASSNPTTVKEPNSTGGRGNSNLTWSSLFRNQAAAAAAATPQQSTTSKVNKPIAGKAAAVAANSSSLPVNSHAHTNGNSDHHSQSTDNSHVTSTNNSKSHDVLKNLGALFKECQLKHSAPALQPRGIHNRQNWCYVNATLQALLACPPFYNLIKSVYGRLKSSNANTAHVPFLAALGRFVTEFKVMVRQGGESSGGGGGKSSGKELIVGEPFDVDYFYDALQQATANGGDAAAFAKTGRQEDAQELLSFLLNRLHDEMVKCLDSLNPVAPAVAAATSATSPAVVNNNHGLLNGAGQNDAKDSNDDDDWKEVGKKNRAYVTRKAEFKQSPLSDIFCGQFRSALSQPGVKDKESVSLEPFFTLPLEIQVCFFFLKAVLKSSFLTLFNVI